MCFTLGCIHNWFGFLSLTVTNNLRLSGSAADSGFAATAGDFTQTSGASVSGVGEYHQKFKRVVSFGLKKCLAY